MTHVGNKFLKTGGADRLFRKISAFMSARGRVVVRQSICVGSEQYDPKFCSTFPHPVVLGGRPLIKKAIESGDCILTWGGVDLNSMGLAPHVCVYNMASESTTNFSRSSRCVTHCIAATEKVARLVHDFQSTVIYPGIDSGELLTGSCRESTRSRIGLSDSDLLVAMIGRIDSNKNQSMLVNAMHKITDRGIRAVFVGEGPELHTVSKSAPKSCIFVGHSESVGEWYRAADVKCILSSRETFPATLLESSFFGKPLITTLPGILGKFLNEKNSWVVSNADQLASAIKSARGLSKSQLAAVGESIKHIYKEHGDYRATARKWEELFIKLHGRLGKML